MASFWQWRTATAKEPTPRQITWLCGTEPVLVDEVVATIKKALAPAAWDYVPLVVGEDSEREVWAQINQYPVGSGNRLVVIRNADRLQRLDRLPEFIKARTSNPRTHLVFISNEEKIARTEPTPEEKREGKKGRLVPHLAAIGTKGHVIECRPFTQSTAKYAIAWVQDKVRMREGIAAHLLNRANGDLRLVRDLCAKLALFPEQVSISTVNGMLTEQPRDSFVNALLALDRPTALLALREMTTNDYSRTIGLLDSRLDLAGLVHDMLAKHHPQYEIAAAASSQAFLVPDLMPVAKHYDAKRRHAIRRVLAVADEAMRGGNYEGVMEIIVAFW